MRKHFPEWQSRKRSICSSKQRVISIYTWLLILLKTHVVLVRVACGSKLTPAHVAPTYMVYIDSIDVRTTRMHACRITCSMLIPALYEGSYAPESGVRLAPLACASEQRNMCIDGKATTTSPTRASIRLMHVYIQ